MSRPTIIVILGMHRSGTSCLAGTLQQQGLHLGQVSEWNPHNLRGNRENSDVMGLNDAVLMTSNGSWDHPPESLVWNREHAERRDVIIEVGTSGARTSWGFKDPRTLLTLQFWQEAPAAFSFVGSFRHPLLVARSLEARNRMDVTAALSLWKHYNDSLLRLQRVHGFPLVSFDASAEEYAETLQQVRDYLHLPAAQSDGVEFLDDQLRHRDLPSTELPRDVALVYDQLLDVYRHPPGHPR